MEKIKSERLFCLDALRGLDMFLLATVEIGYWAWYDAFGVHPWLHRQLNHYWGGFTFWDIVMPLFIFMCGAAVPLALPRRLEDGRATWNYWRHVLGRVALLWALGMLVQGNLTSLDPMKIHWYSNTLQSIAAGYLIASVLILVKSRWVRWSAPFVLMAAYSVLLIAFGDYSKDGNFAQIVEQKIISIVSPPGSEAFQTGDYTWYLTSLMCGGMTMCGVLATDILKGAQTAWRKAGLLAAYGAAMLAVGWLLVLWIPSIKHIFTASFTLQAMGWCVLALDALYVLTDILRLRRGWGLIILYGQFALTAYFVGHFCRPVLETAAKLVTRGFPHAFGMRPEVLGVVNCAIMCTLLTLVLVVRRRLGKR